MRLLSERSTCMKMIVFLQNKTLTKWKTNSHVFSFWIESLVIRRLCKTSYFNTWGWKYIDVCKRYLSSTFFASLRFNHFEVFCVLQKSICKKDNRVPTVKNGLSRKVHYFFYDSRWNNFNFLMLYFYILITAVPDKRY